MLLTMKQIDEINGYCIFRGRMHDGLDWALHRPKFEKMLKALTESGVKGNIWLRRGYMVLYYKDTSEELSAADLEIQRIRIVEALSFIASEN
jgi:hypothetical protein